MVDILSWCLAWGQVSIAFGCGGVMDTSAKNPGSVTPTSTLAKAFFSWWLAWGQVRACETGAWEHLGPWAPDQWIGDRR
jgi:hypothetical protein